MERRMSLLMRAFLPFPTLWMKVLLNLERQLMMVTLGGMHTR